MKKVNTMMILFVVGIMLTGCNSSLNESTTTHVKDLVQSDVFEVLPDETQQVRVYNTSEEIEGEYLELAKVEIQEVSKDNSTELIIEKLKKESSKLGGNGILLVEKSVEKNGKMTVQNIKAIAVYALDSMPAGHQLVKL